MASEDVVGAWSQSILDKEREYQEQDLVNNLEWKEATKIIYRKVNGGDYSGNDEDLGKAGMEIMSEFENKFADITDPSRGMLGFSSMLSESTPEEQAAFYYMMDAYDKKDISLDGISRAAKEMSLDLTNYIGVGTLGYGFAGKLAAKKAAKEGLKATLKNSLSKYLQNTTAVAATEGAIFAGTEDVARQNVAVQAGGQDEINLGQTAIASGIGAGATAGMVKGLEVAAPEVASWAGRKINELEDTPMGKMITGKQEIFAGGKATGFKQAQAEGKTFSDTADKLERFWIDDTDAKMLPIDGKVSYRIDEVIDHPELFKNYPELASMRVSAGKSNYYSPQLKHIKISKFDDVDADLIKAYEAKEQAVYDKYEKIAGEGELTPKQEAKAEAELSALYDDLRSNLTDKKTFNKSILLHEIQHAIQEIEGFAKGGDTKNMESIADYFIESGAEKRLNELEKIPEDELSGKEKWELVRLQRHREDAFKEIDEYDGDVKMNKYLSLAGEQESRAVEAKLKHPNLTPYEALKKEEGKIRKPIVMDKSDIAMSKQKKKFSKMTRAELEHYNTDELDKIAFGVNIDDQIKLDTKDITPTGNDIENAEYKFEKGGMDWVRSVDFSEPIEVYLKDGKYYIEDGHHRWFASKKLNRKIDAIIVDIKNNPIDEILGVKNE